MSGKFRQPLLGPLQGFKLLWSVKDYKLKPRDQRVDFLREMRGLLLIVGVLFALGLHSAQGCKDLELGCLVLGLL